MNNIGQRIRLLRNKQGLSQECIAFDLGITQSSYARLEKQDDRITITRLIQIAHILKTTVSDLIEEKMDISSRQYHHEKAYSFVDNTQENIKKTYQDHINTLKAEIVFLRKLLGN